MARPRSRACSARRSRPSWSRCRRSRPASRMSARRSPRPPSAAISSARARCCSSTRSIGSRKTQQDALLPHVEAGTVTLIGATTENPSFGVVAALLSRCRIVRLESLADDELAQLVTRAVADTDRGLGAMNVTIEPEVVAQIVSAAAGDARRLYSVLEVAASSLARRWPRDHRRARRRGGAGQVAALRQGGRRALRRGLGVHQEHARLDPDAAVYWMTRMLEAGEDPRFVLRRMVIFASEDVGNADPQALVVATAALSAVELVGLPEGVLPLTQAVIYLALAPKSNRALTTYAAARKLVKEHGALPVPAKLRPGIERGRARARPRRVVQVSARLRGRVRARGVPARRAGRRADLRAERLRLRGRAGAPAGRARREEAPLTDRRGRAVNARRRRSAR